MTGDPAEKTPQRVLLPAGYRLRRLRGYGDPYFVRFAA
jgi:hypothetical protein